MTGIKKIPASEFKKIGFATKKEAMSLNIDMLDNETDSEYLTRLKGIKAGMKTDDKKPKENNEQYINSLYANSGIEPLMIEIGDKSFKLESYLISNFRSVEQRNYRVVEGGENITYEDFYDILSYIFMVSAKKSFMVTFYFANKDNPTQLTYRTLDMARVRSADELEAYLTRKALEGEMFGSDNQEEIINDYNVILNKFSIISMGNIGIKATSNDDGEKERIYIYVKKEITQYYYSKEKDKEDPNKYNYSISKKNKDGYKPATCIFNVLTYLINLCIDPNDPPITTYKVSPDTTDFDELRNIITLNKIHFNTCIVSGLPNISKLEKKIYKRNKISYFRIESAELYYWYNTRTIEDLDIEMKVNYKCNYICYDHLNKHVYITDYDKPTLEKNIYTNMGGSVNLLLDDNSEVTEIISAEQMRSIDKNKFRNKKLKVAYLNFDFETVIEFKKKGFLNPYSVSYTFVNSDVAKFIEILDRMYDILGDSATVGETIQLLDKFNQPTEEDILYFGADYIETKETKLFKTFSKLYGNDALDAYIEYFNKHGVLKIKDIAPIIREQTTKNIIAFNCDRQLVRVIRDLIRDNNDTILVLQTFNGAAFDNILLYRALCEEKRECGEADMLKFSITYVNNQILNINIGSTHYANDIRKFLPQGGLKELCKNFKLKLFSKLDADHNAIQADYDYCVSICNENLFIEKMKKNLELQQYNDYDTLSSLLLWQRFAKTITTIDMFPCMKEPIFTNQVSKFYYAEMIGEKIAEINKDKQLTTEQRKIKTAELKREFIEYDFSNSKTNTEIEKFGYNKISDIEKKKIDSRRIYWQNSANFLSRYMQTIHKKMTIGSFAMGLFHAYWSLIQYNPVKLDLEWYNKIKDGRIGGRVDLFAGGNKYVSKFDEGGAIYSMDVCSLYPYVMAILNVYYPSGDFFEIARDSDEFEYAIKHPTLKKMDDDLNSEVVRFFTVDVDQTILRKKNIPYFLCEKRNGVNNYDIPIIKNITISSASIDYLQKLGCSITYYNCIEYKEVKKSCELFRPLLCFMNLKNQQDEYLKNNDQQYNCSLRNVLKLLSNCVSGKVNEGLHEEQQQKITSYEYMQMYKTFAEPSDEKEITKMSIVDVIDDDVYVKITQSTESLLRKQKPIAIGSLVYEYSRIYMHKIYTVVGYDNCLYTDTDAIKFNEKGYKLFLEYCENNNVPHFKAVENDDPLYKKIKMYDANNKVYGSFEDELSGMRKNYGSGDSMILYTYQKKFWMCCVMSKENEIKALKWRGKGVNEKCCVVSENSPFIIKKIGKKTKEVTFKLDMSKSDEIQKYANNPNNQLKNNTNVYNLFESLHNKKSVFILKASFTKIIGNPNRNVKIDDVDKFNSDIHKIKYNINLTILNKI